jgi:AcrR family transcriptional regulator
MGMKKTKKEKIIEKAMEMFFAGGIQTTSMDDIAEQVPAAKMTLYKYFKSKEGLLSEVLDLYIDRQHKLFLGFINDYADPLEAILAMMAYKQESIPEQFLKEMVGNYPQFSAKMMDFYRNHIAKEFEKLILQAQQKGQIRREISPFILMLYVQATKEFLSRPDTIQQLSDFHLIGEQIRNMFLYGIVAPEYHKE